MGLLRHVTLPREMLKEIPPDYFDREAGTLKLLLEDEWRGLGILQVSHPAQIAKHHANTFLESRMEALRDPPARAPHSSF